MATTRTHTLALVRVDLKAKTFDIVDAKQEFWHWGDPYYIDFDRAETAEHLLGWIQHLSGKVWWTTDHVDQLVDAWSGVTGKVVHPV